jgi:hypothetical protein
MGNVKDKMPLKVLAIEDCNMGDIKILTEGKWYNVIDIDFNSFEYDEDDEDDYCGIETIGCDIYHLVDDTGADDWYESDLFKTLDEVRYERLNELLDDM